MSETITPEVGMECTICFYSDSRPAKVSRIISPKRIEVKELSYKCIKGSAQDGSAEYEYFDDPNGAERIFSLRKNGKWIIVGNSTKDGIKLSLGHAHYYYDPHF